MKIKSMTGNGIYFAIILILAMLSGIALIFSDNQAINYIAANLFVLCFLSITTRIITAAGLWSPNFSSRNWFATILLTLMLVAMQGIFSVIFWLTLQDLPLTRPPNIHDFLPALIGILIPYLSGLIVELNDWDCELIRNIGF